jgi:hypothetical protein
MRVDPANRRRFLHGLTATGVAAFAPGVFAQQLAETANVGEGPFYPTSFRSTPTTIC